MPAIQSPQYNVVVPTLQDSSSSGVNRHIFLVTAHTSNPNVFYILAADSGYSVDNLSPLPPKNLKLSSSPGIVALSWEPNSEADLFGYIVYRGTGISSFEQYAITLDTMYADTAPDPMKPYYAVRAKDIHGNLSDPSIVTVTDIHQTRELPTEYALEQNYPNPFNPQTTIYYALPQSKYVRLIILNLLGQEIATLVDEMQDAGYKSVIFDTDRLSSGIYFYKLEVGNYCKMKKMILIK